MVRNPGLVRSRDAYVDRWTAVHLVWGVLLAVLLPRFTALIVLVLWEPLFYLLLSPRLPGARAALAEARVGRPTLRNVLVDLVMDVAGVLLGVYVVRAALGLSGPLLFG